MTEWPEHRPPMEWSRLQKLVWMLLRHGNKPNKQMIAVLALHNPWTSADAILTEFNIQMNGSRKLPEEVAATIPPVVAYEGDAK